MASRLRPSRLGRHGVVWVVGVLAMLLGVAGAGAWLLTRQSEATTRTVTATVTSGTFQDTVSATGTLAPTRQADLDFAVRGRVTQVKVAPGDEVTKGEVLARLDRTSLEASHTSARAQLAAARAQYADDVAASASAVQLAADSAAVAAADSALSQARDDLDAATLRATITGTVASVDLKVGDQVDGTSPSSSSSGSSPQSSPGSGPGSSPGSNSAAGAAAGTGATGSTTSAVVIVSPRLFKVEANVSADDVTSVQEGMQAEVTPSGASEAVFGTVTSVGLVAEVGSSGAATFPVTVSLTGPQTKLYTGTSASVSIITKQVVDVLSVPTLALHTSGETTYVEKLIDGAKVRTTVELGATYGASTEVVSGLKSGDQVIITTVRVPSGGSNRPGGNQREGGGGFPGGDTGAPRGGPPGGGFPGGDTGGFPGAPPGGGFGGSQ